MTAKSCGSRPRGAHTRDIRVRRSSTEMIARHESGAGASAAARRRSWSAAPDRSSRFRPIRTSPRWSSAASCVSGAATGWCRFSLSTGSSRTAAGRCRGGFARRRYEWSIRTGCRCSSVARSTRSRWRRRSIATSLPGWRCSTGRASSSWSGTASAWKRLRRRTRRDGVSDCGRRRCRRPRCLAPTRRDRTISPRRDPGAVHGRPPGARHADARRGGRRGAPRPALAAG